MNQSNKLCDDLICNYTDFEKTNLTTFKGYKLVEKKNLNYYSIVSGLFRYRSKRVSENSYHSLYEREQKHYCENLVNKLAIFKNVSDAYNALIDYEKIADYKCELVILEITISGDIEKASYSNKKIKKAEVYIGHTIERVKEVPYKKN